MDITIEQLKEKLNQFTGSSKFYKLQVSEYSMLITEGVQFLCSIAGAYWLADIVLSYQYDPKLYKEEFQTWELIREKGDSFKVIATNGNKQKLAEQYIPFSDFPLDGITLFLSGKTLMLPTEY